MTSEWIDHAATSIEILGAVVLVCGIAYTLSRAVIGLVITRTPDLTYQRPSVGCSRHPRGIHA